MSHAALPCDYDRNQHSWVGCRLESSPDGQLTCTITRRKPRALLQSRGSCSSSLRTANSNLLAGCWARWSLSASGSARPSASLGRRCRSDARLQRLARSAWASSISSPRSLRRQASCISISFAAPTSTTSIGRRHGVAEGHCAGQCLGLPPTGSRY